MGTRNTLMPLWHVMRGGLTWLLYDEFITDDATPIADPRTCEPGPGVADSVDTTNKMSISGGNLVMAGNATGNPGLWFGTNGGGITGINFAAGNAWHVAVSSAATNTVFDIGVDDNRAGAPQAPRFVFGSSANLQISSSDFGGTKNISSYSAATLYNLLIIARPTAGFYFIRDGILEFVLTEDAAKTAHYPCVSNNIAALTVPRVGLIDLPANAHAEWKTSYGPATNRVASPSSGETTTSVANSWNEFTWTVAAAETLEWLIRRTDDTHAWSIRCDQAGSTIKIIEINSGETERASSAQTWTDTNDYKVVAIADNETIKTFVAGVIKNTYSSASYNKTVTGVKISGFAAGANLVCWPRDVSLLLPPELV